MLVHIKSLYNYCILNLIFDILQNIFLNTALYTHLQEDHGDPVWHLVCVCHAVVVVEDHDGGHTAARHHEHDRGEVGA